MDFINRIMSVLAPNTFTAASIPAAFRSTCRNGVAGCHATGTETFGALPPELEQTIMAQGEAAFRKGRTWQANPYPHRPLEGQAWAKGFEKGRVRLMGW